jgi:hypothetical protein
MRVGSWLVLREQRDARCPISQWHAASACDTGT